MTQTWENFTFWSRRRGLIFRFDWCCCCCQLTPFYQFQRVTKKNHEFIEEMTIDLLDITASTVHAHMTLTQKHYKAQKHENFNFFKRTQRKRVLSPQRSQRPPFIEMFAEEDSSSKSSMKVSACIWHRVWWNAFVEMSQGWQFRWNVFDEEKE